MESQVYDVDSLQQLLVRMFSEAFCYRLWWISWSENCCSAALISSVWKSGAVTGLKQTTRGITLQGKSNCLRLMKNVKNVTSLVCNWVNHLIVTWICCVVQLSRPDLWVVMSVRSMNADLCCLTTSPSSVLKTKLFWMADRIMLINCSSSPSEYSVICDSQLLLGHQVLDLLTNTQVVHYEPILLCGAAACSWRQNLLLWQRIWICWKHLWLLLSGLKETFASCSACAAADRCCEGWGRRCSRGSDSEGSMHQLQGHGGALLCEFALPMIAVFKPNQSL